MSKIKECFIISPIGKENSDTRKHSDKVLRYLIEPITESLGYRTIRADKMSNPGMITNQIIDKIINAPLVIADLTDSNPNVFYELAIRHMIGKPLIQITSMDDKIPFDVLDTRTIHYDITNLDSVETAKTQIMGQIQAISQDNFKMQTPISSSLDLTPIFQNNPIGLFLDVDETLTKESIQTHYAKILGCEKEFEKIEERWRKNEIDADQFSHEMIPLFAKHGLTEQLAEEIADKTKMHSWTESILSLPVEKYLVSSGPNYYIRKLATDLKIPKENILCSEYEFDNKTGKLSSCKKPVSSSSKASFVEKHGKKHFFTIGVGDHPANDGPFISKCTLPILNNKTDSYLFSPNLEIIINTVNQVHNEINNKIKR